jgi:hypothetical protein
MQKQEMLAIAKKPAEIAIRGIRVVDSGGDEGGEANITGISLYSFSSLSVHVSFCVTLFC